MSQSDQEQRCKLMFHSKAEIPNRLRHLYPLQQVDQILLQKQEEQVNNISKLSQAIESLQINLFKEKNLINRGCISLSTSNINIPPKSHDTQQCENLLIKMHKISNLTNHQQLKVSVNKSKQPSNYLPYSSDKNIYDKIQRKNLILELKDKSLRNVSIQRVKPQNLVHENKPITKFKEKMFEAEIVTENRSYDLQTSLHKFKLHSSTESIATNSSFSSMESLRSSTSESNHSTSSSESRHSKSLSSHSSDNDYVNDYLRQYQNQQQLSSLSLCHHLTKLHNISLVSDNSLPNLTCEISVNNISQKTKSEKFPSSEINPAICTDISIKQPTISLDKSLLIKKRRVSQNKKLINLVLESSLSGDTEIQGSDSGISIESRKGIKCKKTLDFQLIKMPPSSPLKLQEHYFNITRRLLDNEKELLRLPFDMPKLNRRRVLVQQDTTTSGSLTSVDLKDLPFDMPKLRRRLRCMQSTESTTSQISSDLSSTGVGSSIFRKFLLLLYILKNH
jgi:hypothetical protein